MGGVSYEYVEPLHVGVMRVWGAVTAGDLAAAVISANKRHRTVHVLWDISDANVEGWTRDRLEALIALLAPEAARRPGKKIALVGAEPPARAVCANVYDLFAEYRYPIEVEVFRSRPPALAWLGVMHLPIGAGAASLVSKVP